MPSIRLTGSCVSIQSAETGAGGGSQPVTGSVSSNNIPAINATPDASCYLFLLDRFREPVRDDFREGTFAPLSRASLSAIAIACFRLVTFRPELLFSVPFFLRRIADSTFLDADLPYFAIFTSLAPRDSRTS
jgi:hypothetical protein